MNNPNPTANEEKDVPAGHPDDYPLRRSQPKKPEGPDPVNPPDTVKIEDPRLPGNEPH